jgi:uncharacterized membrane protein YeiB
MILNILDILRILIVAVALFFRYKIGFTDGYHPVAQLHFMIPVVIIAISENLVSWPQWESISGPILCGMFSIR